MSIVHADVGGDVFTGKILNVDGVLVDVNVSLDVAVDYDVVRVDVDYDYVGLTSRRRQIVDIWSINAFAVTDVLEQLVLNSPELDAVDAGRWVTVNADTVVKFIVDAIGRELGY